MPAGQAVVPLGDIAYAYGFGVYETVRISGGKIFFLADHCERLMRSAQIIGLEHNFSAESVAESIAALVKENRAETCNVKLMLIGGQTANDAAFYAMCLNPLFPRRELYKTGASCTVFEYERDYPSAKTLNMLPSYLAYRQAKTAGAYEALLVNRLGDITEGTRSNFFVIKDQTIISPPSGDILPGITRAKVLEVADAQGFKVIEEPIPLTGVDKYDGAFLTSTSAKIMPIKQIGETDTGPPPPGLRQLIKAFNEYLAAA